MNNNNNKNANFTFSLIWVYSREKEAALEAKAICLRLRPPHASRTKPGRFANCFKVAVNFAMALNTKDTERELKTQRTWKFFVNYKRREKYKNSCSPLLLLLNRCRSNEFVPASLGVAHDTNATRRTTRTTAPPCPSHTRRTRGTGRAGAYEAGFVFRVVVVVASSSSAVRRPVTSWGVLELPEIQQPPENETSFPQRDQRRPKKPGFWAFLERVFLVAFFHCTMRPLAGPVGAGTFLVWGVSVFQYDLRLQA